jgi:two-component system sensor histidine kinase SenX3
MRVTGRGKTIAFFIVLGACLVALALALNIGWIVLNVRQVAMLVFGIIFFVAIIAGLVLNTTFLVREIKRNEQHDAFINAVTHELKTPIASIRLYLETLKTRNVDEARRREFYDIMLADSERLLQTIEQVLRAGQHGVKKSRDHRVVLDFGKLVAECVELTRTRHHLDADALNVHIATAESVNAKVNGDPDELQTAVLNLLDNAIKYSDKETRVDVRVETPGKQNVSLQITDHGIGIPREQLKRIFKRFYRAPGKLVGRIKGTGLGLFIVSSIVKKHGGRVFAESDGEGSGSTFTVLLPRAEKS